MPLTIGKHYLKSPLSNVGMPPIIFLFSLKSYIVNSIDSNTIFCKTGASSIIIAEHYLIKSASLPYFDIEHGLFSSILIGTLKALCTVYPFSNNVAAIPFEAVENISKFSDNK